MQFIALFMYACSDCTMSLLSCACLCNNKWYHLYLFEYLLLHSAASSCSASSLTWPHVVQHKQIGVLLREKHPCNNFIQKLKGVGLFLEDGPIFRKLWHIAFSTWLSLDTDGCKKCTELNCGMFMTYLYNHHLAFSFLVYFPLAFHLECKMCTLSMLWRKNH